MPKVTLDFEITDKGTAVVKQMVSETQKAIAQMGQTAGQAGTGMATLDDHLTKTTLSARQMHQAIMGMSAGFGGVNPVITGAVLDIGRFSNEMQGLSKGAQVVTAGIVGIGVAVSAMAYAFDETERIAVKFSAIDRAVRSLDFSTVRTGLKDVGIQFESLDRQASTWQGRMKLNMMGNIKNWMGLPNDYEEADLYSAKLRKGLQEMLPWEEGAQTSAYAKQASGLDVKTAQAYLQSNTAKATLDLPGIKAIYEKIAEDVAKEAGAAMDEAWYTRQKEFLAAGSNVDIEREGINKKYWQSIDLITRQRDLTREGLLSAQFGSERDLTGRQESVRAGISGSGIETLAAQVERQKLLVESNTKWRDAREKRWASTVGLGPSSLWAEVPGARDLIQQEQTLRMAQIDEELKKKLVGIDQLQVRDSDRVDLVAAAQRSADAQRLLALDQTYAKQDALRTQTIAYKDEIAASAAKILNALVPAYDQALQAEQQSLSGLGGSSGIGTGAAGSPGSVGALMTKTGAAGAGWWTETERQLAQSRVSAMEQSWGIPMPEAAKSEYLRLQLQGGVGQTQIESDFARLGLLTQQNKQNGLVPGTKAWNVGLGLGTAGMGGFDTAEGGGGYGAAEGGVVPGPIGRPLRATVHGGEVVANPGQQAQILDQIMNGGGAVAGGGDLVIHVNMNGKSVVNEIRIPLMEAIRSRSIPIQVY